MATRRDWGQPQVGGQGFARTVKTIGRRVIINAADDVAAGVVGAFTLPPGFVATAILCISSAFAAGLTFTVGDAAVANRFLTTGVPGATNVTLNPAGGLLYKTPAETEVLITVGAPAAGNVPGTIDLYITGFIDN